MLRLVLPNIVIGLSLAVSASASDLVAVPMPAVPPSGSVKPIPPGTVLQHSYYAANADGTFEQVDGGTAHLSLAYSDTGVAGYFAGGAASAPPHIVADGLSVPARKDFEVGDFSFAYTDLNANTLATFTAVVSFYTAVPPAAGGAGALVGGPFNIPGLPVGAGRVIHVDLGALAFCCPPNFYLQVDYSDATVQGGDAGPIITGNPGGLIGISGDTFAWDGNIAQGGVSGPAGNYFFNGNPHADFYYEVGTDYLPPALAPSTPGTALWDMGPPNPVIFNAALSNLGYSSGNLGAGSTERWAAIPFRIAANTTISTIDADWFVLVGSEADNVNYKIWNRVGLAAPVGPAYSEGVLGPYGVGVDDPEFVGVEDWLHRYFVNIPIAAGDYYLSIYGDGGPVANNVPWLTGAFGVDESLEQAFMWRSATFPVPGFVAYNPANVQPNGAQDPGDLWNPSFTLYAGGVAPCAFDPCDANCDGSVNLFDIDPFVSALTSGSGCSPCAADSNIDGSVNLFDIDAFVNCLSDPC